MNNEQALLSADSARRDAMISGDMNALDRLLSEELVWTHSSGKTEGKAAVMAAIKSGSVTYKVLSIDEYTITQHNDISIYLGVLNGSASRNGVEKNLKSKFLSVWKKKDASYRMLVWQSTGF